MSESEAGVTEAAVVTSKAGHRNRRPTASSRLSKGIEEIGWLVGGTSLAKRRRGDRALPPGVAVSLEIRVGCHAKCLGCAHAGPGGDPF